MASLLILPTPMTPFATIMIPRHVVMTAFGLQDSNRGLLVPFPISALGVFPMR